MRLRAGLLIGVVAFGGCGDQARLSKTEYEWAVIGIRSQDGREASRLFTRLVAVELPQAECADGMHRLHESLERIVGDVEDLRPPKPVERLQDEFLAAGRVSVAEVGQVGEEVELGRVRCGNQLNRRIYGLPATRRAQRVLEEFRLMGDRFGFE